nr:NifB/NifX family molybdenum-iron cluster-binding protein [candidate division Zixibacteria bacterium]
MRIAIPMAEGRLSAHFGHCQEFALIDVDTDNKKIMKSERLVPPPHEPGVLPGWLAQMDCNLIIAGGMGHRAISMFNQNGISVVTGAMALKPEEIVMSYLNGQLIAGENTCDNPTHHHGEDGRCRSHQNES